MLCTHNLSKYFFLEFDTMTRNLPSTLIILFFLSNSHCQKPQLELSEIMGGNDFIGTQPNNLNWSPDSKEVYFKWDKETSNILPYYKYILKTNSIENMTSLSTRNIPIEGHLYNENKSIVYFKQNNSLFIWSQKNGVKLIYSNLHKYKIISLNSQGDFLIRINNNLHHFNPNSGYFIQLTNFVSGKQKKTEKPSFLEKQQLSLFEVQRKRKIETDKRNKEKEIYMKGFQPTIYLNKEELEWIELQEDSNNIIYETTVHPTNTKTIYPSYITKNGQTQTKEARAKVGSKDAKNKLFIYKSSTKKTKEIDASNLNGIYSKADFLYKIYKDTIQKYN